MKYWTYGEIRTKVETDLDLQDETFISYNEMLGYANEAIDEVERQIHDLCSDYFLTRANLVLVDGQEAYDLPSDIYAVKIRSIVYRNGTLVWKFDRIRDWYKFEQYEFEKTNLTGNSRRYGYFVVNTTPGQPQILITPTPNEDGAYGKMWYIRNANEMVDDTSVCDIPEAVNYVMAYMKMKCMEKELHPNLPKISADVDSQRADTLKNLSEMYPDNETEIEADTRLYDDMN